MNVMLSLFFATAAIAAMIAIRIFVFQRALEARLKTGRPGNNCDTSSCFHDCAADEPGNVADSATNRKKSKRSASHAY